VSSYPALRAVAGVLAVALAAGCAPTRSTNTAASGRLDSRQGFVSGDGTVTVVAPATRVLAPALTGELLDGTRFDLAAHRGRVVVINFWYPSCPPCRKEAPVLERVRAATQSLGVVFVGVNTREPSRDQALVFQRRYRLGYSSLIDTDGQLVLGFRGTMAPNAIPATLVIDRAGRVAARVLGAVSTGTLRALIDDALAETP
jgi:thiol-disulfide isomerase/thioredoxin